jgi:glucose-6-phosphate isomerase
MVPYDFALDLQERNRGIDRHVFDRRLTVIVDYYAPVQDDIHCQKTLSIVSSYSGKTVKTSYEV